MFVYRILVAENEPLALKAISDILSEQGYQIDSVEDGLQAWNRLDNPNNFYDLVVLDRLMPGLEGTELLRRMRADRRFFGLPVIFQSALSANEMVEEGLKAGAIRYLTKPYTPDSLLKAVRETLAPPRGRMN